MEKALFLLQESALLWKKQQYINEFHIVVVLKYPNFSFSEMIILKNASLSQPQLRELQIHLIFETTTFE